MTQFRASIDEYTNRVLGVIKERYGLKDKSEALNKFAQMYGEEFVPFELKPEVEQRLKAELEEDEKKYRNRIMTLKELDMLCDK